MINLHDSQVLTFSQLDGYDVITEALLRRRCHCIRKSCARQSST